MKAIDELINDGQCENFVKNMKHAVEIFGEHLPKNINLTEVQNRYVSNFCCYFASFALYIQELTQSYDTLNFLTIMRLEEVQLNVMPLPSLFIWTML